MKVKKTTSAVISGAVLGLLLLVFLAAEVIVGETSVSYLYSIDSYGIHRQDVSTGSEKIIFNTTGMYGVSFSLSPSDTAIAVLITKRGVVPPGAHDYSVLPKNSLVFIDPDGNEITRLDDDVRELSWSPDGEKIAYITGTYYEGGVGFKTTGVWIFDLGDGSKTPITIDFPHPELRGYEGGGFEINWARHDSIIYIRDFGYLAGIYRYDTRVGKSEKVDYKGIDFSPDGKYYSSYLAELGYHVYFTETNEPVTERVHARFKDLRFPPSWAPGHDHCLQVAEVGFLVEPYTPGRRGREVLGIKQKKYTIYDIETDSIIKEWVEKPEE